MMSCRRSHRRSSYDRETWRPMTRSYETTTGMRGVAIRLPQLEAPTATLDGRRNQGATGTPGFATSTFCSDTPWRSIERRWRSLYPNHDAFVAKFSEAVDRLEQDGYLLKPEADQAKRAARESGIGH